MWVKEPNTKRSHIPYRDHPQQIQLEDLGVLDEFLVFSPLYFFSTLFSQALSVLQFSKTDLTLSFIPNKPLKQIRK